VEQLPVARVSARLRRVGRGALALGAVLASFGCHGAHTAATPPPETQAECSARMERFIAFVKALPARTVVSAARGDLPVSTLGGVPGPGPVLDISGKTAALDGTPIRAEDVAARVTGVPQLYVAAAADADVQTVRLFIARVPATVELRLLVRMPKLPRGRTSEAEPDVASRLLLEPDPRARENLAADGYAEFAECPAVTEAVSSVNGQSVQQRWPLLQAALGRALPACACAKVNTVNLQPLVAAEQRASGATLGWVPISFLRDEACGASMPLRSMRKLIGQVETFDAEFAGNYNEDALKFADVVTNDRLRVYFCNALPGETLAAQERARATLYLRVPGAGACEPWQFEPLAPGAPMGTWRRRAPSRSPLAFHYWQAAEEIRVFGPVEAGSSSRPTDSRDWECEQTHRLTGMDDDSIELDSGRWFFSEAACRHAPEDLARPGPCVAAPSAPSPGSETPLSK
jgi:hypothetical protein